MNTTLTLCKTALHLHNKWVRIMLIVSVLILVSLIFLPEEKKIKGDLTKEIPEIINQVDSLETNKSVIILDTINQQILNNIEKSGTPIKVKIIPSKKFDWKGITTFIISAINGIIIFILNVRKFFAKKLLINKSLNK